MKISLDHLPDDKRAELEHIGTVLRESFAAWSVRGTQPWRRNGKISKIILFGSFARGDWVDEPQNGYQSDWDLLIVVDTDRLAKNDFWDDAETRFLKDPRVKRPMTLIVHTLEEVNAALARGEYFWTDIIRDGVFLFERPDENLASPKQLTPKEALDMATGYYEPKSKDVEIRLEDATRHIANVGENQTSARTRAMLRTRPSISIRQSKPPMAPSFSCARSISLRRTISNS
jgi:predicted nucleotidyltransferase